MSPEARLRQVLKGELPGEGKPSLILSRIKNLSADKCSEDVIRAVFLDQLPSGCRAALAISGLTDTVKIAEMADRFIEASDIGGSCTAVSATTNDVSELKAQIDVLSAKIDSIVSREAGNSQNRRFFKNRSKTPNRKNNNNFRDKNNNGMCFYHNKFGNRAFKCTPSCIHYEIFKSTHPGIHNKSGPSEN